MVTSKRVSPRRAVCGKASLRRFPCGPYNFNAGRSLLSSRWASTSQINSCLALAKKRTSRTWLPAREPWSATGKVSTFSENTFWGRASVASRERLETPPSVTNHQFSNPGWESSSSSISRTIRSGLLPGRSVCLLSFAVVSSRGFGSKSLPVNVSVVTRPISKPRKSTPLTNGTAADAGPGATKNKPAPQRTRANAGNESRMLGVSGQANNSRIGSASISRIGRPPGPGNMVVSRSMPIA